MAIFKRVGGREEDPTREFKDAGKPPYPQTQARKVLSVIAKGGTVTKTGHATTQQAERGISDAEVEQALLAGRCDEPPEWENGGWRYRFHGAKAAIAVEFEAEDRAVIVTAMPPRKR